MVRGLKMEEMPHHSRLREIAKLGAQSHRDHNWNTDKPAQRTYECSCGAQSIFCQWVIQIYGPEQQMNLDVTGIGWSNMSMAVALYRDLKKNAYKGRKVLFCARYQVSGGLPTRGTDTETRDFTDLVTDFVHRFRKIRPTRWDWLRRDPNEDKDGCYL